MNFFLFHHGPHLPKASAKITTNCEFGCFSAFEYLISNENHIAL